MTIASTNPATGETLKTFTPIRRRHRGEAPQGGRRREAVAAHHVCGTRPADVRAAVLLEQRKDALAA